MSSIRISPLCNKPFDKVTPLQGSYEDGKKSNTVRKDTHSKAGQKPIKTEPPASAEQTA